MPLTLTRRRRRLLFTKFDCRWLSGRPFGVYCGRVGVLACAVDHSAQPAALENLNMQPSKKSD
jgi:hypothetical protein